jgi:hypothetical protein
MKTLPIYGLISAMVLFASCKDDKPSQATPQKELQSTKIDIRPVIWLEAVYATSVQDKLPIDNLFDADAETAWETSAGIGPEEGIMLRFQSNTAIGAILLEPIAALAQGNVIAYINGQALPAQSTTKPIEVQKLCKSIFLRFQAHPEQLNFADSGVEKSRIGRFDPKLNFGLKSIQITDDQGIVLRIAPPKTVAAQLNASSTLAPEQAYGVHHLFDARKEFVYVEGAKDLGEGQEVKCQFEEVQSITAIKIWNGYQRSANHYTQNARVRDFEFGANSGLMHTYTLNDDQADQKIELSAVATGQNFDLKIKTAVPGQKYTDLAISEILFFKDSVPFKPLIKTTDLSTQVSGFSKAVLNQLIVNQTDLAIAGAYKKHSIILRSDGSFVYYHDENYADGNAIRTVADGSWEELSSDAQSAKIKLFGNWVNTSKLTDIYEKTQNEQISQIFSDEILITTDRLSGKKFIPTMALK